jgi:hypothetical protein
LDTGSWGRLGRHNNSGYCPNNSGFCSDNSGYCPDKDSAAAVPALAAARLPDSPPQRASSASNTLLTSGGQLVWCSPAPAHP